jgi:hypothetical protein
MPKKIYANLRTRNVTREGDKQVNPRARCGFGALPASKSNVRSTRPRHGREEALVVVAQRGVCLSRGFASRHGAV